MKRFFYLLYAAFFNICRIFPVKKSRVTFLSPHRENFTDSLGAVLKETESRGVWDIVKISSSELELKGLSSVMTVLKFFTVKAYLLATSKYVFLNDNFMPMGSLHFSKKAVVTQLWHAEGVFKKFGLHIPQPENIRSRELAGAEKLTWVVCSSESVVPYYAEAFGVDKSKVLPLGAPRADRFLSLDEAEKAEIREKINKKYPECKGKKLVLYAPTFRDDEAEDRKLLDSIDGAEFCRRLGDEYALLVRLHPQIHRCESSVDGAVDVTDYEDAGELTIACDIMITDYSSVCMDAALIRKPLYFYAFDLEKYNADRSFYFDYKSYVPGAVAEDFTALLDMIERNAASDCAEKAGSFRAFNFGNPDCYASKRVVDTILK
mgnify:CR=1 FL=1